MPALLVDADIVCFQFASVNEVEYQWDEDLSSKVIDLDKAIEELELFIKDLKKELRAKDIVFCFSTPPNWRNQILPSYKSNRKKEKPSLFYALKDYIMTEFVCKTKPSLEADDVIGIMATLKPGKYVIASIDKDLKQIPGKHFNWRTGDLTEVSVEEADRFFYQQVLTGDPTDGYKGCPGIGPKKAAEILDEAGDNPWPAIVAAYESKGLTEEDALVQARVARILRKTEWDFKKQKLKLWVPPE